MCKIKGYHGTNKERGMIMIDEQKMELSEGDRHWLGDGSYLYDDFWAYKWIVDMHKKRYSDNIILKKLSDRYQILTVEIKVKRDRIFDLDKPKYRLMLERAYKEINDKKRSSKEYKEDEILDGAAINYLFNEFKKIKNKFYIIKANFVFKGYASNKYKQNTRLEFLPQVQYCIRNSNIVKSMSVYQYEDNLDYYEVIYERFFDNNSASTYIPRNSGDYIYEE